MDKKSYLNNKVFEDPDDIVDNIHIKFYDQNEPPSPKQKKKKKKKKKIDTEDSNPIISKVFEDPDRDSDSVINIKFYDEKESKSHKKEKKEKKDKKEKKEKRESLIKERGFDDNVEKRSNITEKVYEDVNKRGSSIKIRDFEEERKAPSVKSQIIERDYNDPVGKIKSGLIQRVYEDKGKNYKYPVDVIKERDYEDSDISIKSVIMQRVFEEKDKKKRPSHVKERVYEDSPDRTDNPIETPKSKSISSTVVQREYEDESVKSVSHIATREYSDISEKSSKKSIPIEKDKKSEDSGLKKKKKTEIKETEEDKDKANDDYLKKKLGLSEEEMALAHIVNPHPPPEPLPPTSIIDLHKKEIISIAILTKNAKGIRYATSSKDNTIKLWSESFSLIDTIKNKLFPSACLIEYKEKRLISCEGLYIHVYDIIKTKEIKHKLVDHIKDVKALCVFEDGTLLSGGEDCIIRRWNIKKEIAIQYFEGHDREVIKIEPLSDKNNFISSDNDTFIIWNINGDKLITMNNYFTTLDLVTDELYFCCSGTDDNIRYYNKAYKLYDLYHIDDDADIDNLNVIDENRIAYKNGINEIVILNKPSNKIESVFSCQNDITKIIYNRSKAQIIACDRSGKGNLYKI